MRLIVLVKEVPDTFGDRHLNLKTGLTERASGDRVLDEITERALEVALSHADDHADCEVHVMSLGPVEATTSIRKALAMGAASATHIVDDALVGADLTLTAQALAAAIHQQGFDLVLAGNVSTDGMSGMVPAAIAEHLGVAHVTGLNSISIGNATVTGTRPVEGGLQHLEVDLPAVVSITEALPEPRFPNFKGIMAAKKKPLRTVTLGELEIDAEHPDTARSIMLSVAPRPPRTAGTKLVDDGTAAAKLADYLVEHRLV